MDIMDRLPTVTSCCSCCFLKAGTIVIAIFSFCISILFVPNMIYTLYLMHIKGILTAEHVLSSISNPNSTATETAIMTTLGVASLIFSVVSVVLLVGAILDKPIPILVYQYSAIVYSVIVLVLFFILAIFCFFVHTNSVLAGMMLIGLIILTVALTAYFLIVTNSLRMDIG